MALCKYPYYHHGMGAFFGCGQCHPCRINKRREWTARLMLEAENHLYRSFVTLTYSPEHLPESGDLVPRHLQLFMKRLRKKFSDRKIRFFACGEYGEKNSRPHYHALLFGVDEAEADKIAEVWPYGSVHVGSVTQDSIQYVAGYVLKKNLKKEAKIRDVPEFSRQSLRPGLGASYARNLSSVLSSTGHFPLTMAKGGDIPSQVRIGGKLWPVGRYLKTLARKELGLNETFVKAVNQELLRQITSEKIKEAEEDPSIKAEVLRLKKSKAARFITQDEYLKGVMELYNRCKIERSEKLSKIYQKERVLDE